MSRDIILPGGDTLKLFDSAYTASEVEAILTKALRQPGDNLLRNAYFIGGGSQQGGGQFPINARGQTTYTVGGYTIDGWNLIGSGSVEIVGGGIKLTQTAPYQLYWAQNFEPYISKALAGKTATFSFLCTVNDGMGINVFDGDEWIGGTGTQIGLNTTTITLPNNLTNLRFLFGCSGAGSAIIQAAKMELGDHQTLAHKDANGNWVLNAPPPDFGIELLKCQRYYFVSGAIAAINHTGDYMLGAFTFPTTMRIPPSISITRMSPWYDPGTSLDVTKLSAVAVSKDGFAAIHNSANSFYTPPNYYYLEYIADANL